MEGSPVSLCYNRCTILYLPKLNKSKLLSDCLALSMSNDFCLGQTLDHTAIALKLKGIHDQGIVDICRNAI